MARDRLPEQSRGQAAAQRPAGGGVERSAGAAPTLPGGFEAGTLGWVESPDRFHWWAEIHADVKAYLERAVGPAIEWWADRHEREQDRAYAVVLGPNGLAVTTPRVNLQGQRTQSVRVDRFVSGSLKHAAVHQQATRRPRGGLRSLVSRNTPEPSDAPRLELDEDTRGTLGNLPLEAQQRLQAPFLGSQAVQHYRYYYFGSDEDLDFWCYLAGDRTVTFASGHRTLAAGADPRQAAWRLTCYQADVTR